MRTRILALAMPLVEPTSQRPQWRIVELLAKRREAVGEPDTEAATDDQSRNDADEGAGEDIGRVVRAEVNPRRADQRADDENQHGRSAAPAKR